jgi:hypothetical protein
MRAFGIFAAFATFTAVFAAPLAAPAPATGNSIVVKARDDTVSADIAGIVSGLEASVNGTISQIRAYSFPSPAKFTSLSPFHVMSHI